MVMLGQVTKVGRTVEKSSRSEFEEEGLLSLKDHSVAHKYGDCVYEPWLSLVNWYKTLTTRPS